MAFTDAQISDLYYLLGYPAGYRNTYASMAAALAQDIPADTETRIKARIVTAKAGIVTADALLPLVGIDRDGSSFLKFDRQRRRELGRVRRDIKDIACDLGGEALILRDITNEAPATTGGQQSYAPWG